MSHLEMQFDDPRQQSVAATTGMWIFLGTEVLLFGGLFAGYTIYRYEYADAFAAASHHVGTVSGTAMTAILLFSSLLVALADHAVSHANRKKAASLLATTAFLGIVFLGLKFHEYWTHYQENMVPGELFDRAKFQSEALDGRTAELFFCFYFFMTGLHALHMIIAVGMVTTIAILTARGHYGAEYSTPVKITGLYWHFVDIVWVFLFPLLYMVGGPKG